MFSKQKLRNDRNIRLRMHSQKLLRKNRHFDKNLILKHKFRELDIIIQLGMLRHTIQSKYKLSDIDRICIRVHDYSPNV